MGTRPISPDYRAGWADCLQTLRMMVDMREEDLRRRKAEAEARDDPSGMIAAIGREADDLEKTRVMIDGCRCPTHTR